MNIFKKVLLMSFIVVFLSLTAFAEDDVEVISVYEGSEVIYNDLFGFEEVPVVIDENEVNVLEGVFNRKWCEAPKGRSPLEVIKNYESSIKSLGGDILFVTREPQSIEIDDKDFSEYFKTSRQERGLATRVFSYTYFPELMSEYLIAKVKNIKNEIYIIVAAGRGHPAARQGDVTFFELITLEKEAMEMGMVTIDSLERGLKVYGRVPIYNIHFDTGKSEIKEESIEALSVIAKFLEENQSKKYFVVGHTDIVGDYEMNLDLSKARAKSVVEKLVTEYQIKEEQLMPVGVGPVSPVLSNLSEDGKSKNRRVEIVEAF